MDEYLNQKPPPAPNLPTTGCSNSAFGWVNSKVTWNIFCEALISIFLFRFLPITEKNAGWIRWRVLFLQAKFLLIFWLYVPWKSKSIQIILADQSADTTDRLLVFHWFVRARIDRRGGVFLLACLSLSADILAEKNISVRASALGGTEWKSVVMDTETGSISHTEGDEKEKTLWQVNGWQFN